MIKDFFGYNWNLRSLNSMHQIICNLENKMNKHHIKIQADGIGFKAMKRQNKYYLYGQWRQGTSETSIQSETSLIWPFEGRSRVVLLVFKNVYTS